MNAATDHAVVIHLEFTGDAEGHDLIADLDGQTWEVFGTAFGPFEFHAGKPRVPTGLFDVGLAIIDVTANGAVDAVFGHEDAATEIQRLAEVTLPQLNRFGVGEWGEGVIEENFSGRHSLNSNPPCGPHENGCRRPPHPAYGTAPGALPTNGVVLDRSTDLLYRSCPRLNHFSAVCERSVDGYAARPCFDIRRIEEYE